LSTPDEAHPIRLALNAELELLWQAEYRANLEACAVRREIDNAAATRVAARDEDFSSNVGWSAPGAPTLR
jgi:hypothetical protein